MENIFPQLEEKSKIESYNMGGIDLDTFKEKEIQKRSTKVMELQVVEISIRLSQNG